MGKHICIIGAGITGLACAMKLCSTNQITIVARDMPGDLSLQWASPWAGAVFHPQTTTSNIEQKMQRDCFRFYWDLATTNPESGVQVLPMSEYFDDRENDAELWFKDLLPGYEVTPQNELPEGCTFGVKYRTLAMNPQILLVWLKEELLKNGVTFSKLEVKSIGHVRFLLDDVNIVINASGVGAKELAGDIHVRPIRGQTMFVKTAFNELVMKDGTEYTYVIPRAESGGVIIGGVKSDRLDSEVDIELKTDILERVNRLTKGAFEGIDLNNVTDIIGFRPGRQGGLRVEKEGDVIHAYGTSGAGYIYSFGIATIVNNLIEMDGAVAIL